VSVDGELPRTADGILALRVSGNVDAGMANGLLEASGRRATGRVVLDGRIAGTLQAPQISGRATLSDGDLRDYAAGVHVGAITAELEARRDQLVLTRFDARAGTGTLQASGSIGVLQPGVPVSLHLAAHDAQPIDGQLLRARMDADLTLEGEFQGQLRLAGRISASRAEITIPGTLPTSVPTLDVRRPGHAAPVTDSAAAAARPLAIDVTIEAPRAVFVRGRGLDAEVGGELHWGGTRAAPLVSGGFELRSGRFNLAGKTLEFQSGRVSFNGQGIANQLDPTLDFVASNTSGGVTSTLKVGGYADAPVLTLSSSPERPQDEVLARLLFGASITELSALQLAQMGAAVATLGGVGGGGGPLLSLQRSLGLDRLAISGAQGEGTGASVEVGRYVSRRVYVGTRQNTAGGTQGAVEVDLTQRLKMRAAFGAGAGSSTASAQGSTPTDQAGSTVGLSYELEF
jgi:translocation and assembly module TamB